VRAALSAANANAPKGALEVGPKRYQVYVNDQARTANDFKTLIVAYRNGAAVRLQDVANVSDGVEDIRNLGMANGKPAVLVILTRQPGANIIETVDNVKKVLPVLQASLPPAVHVDVANDRTLSIRASVTDVQITMGIAVLLVMVVVYLFLRNGRATIIPSVAVPLSILGTFGVMYIAGFTIDILSLMALTVATGFVVDDAIVVLENVTRHIEGGMPRLQAALVGTGEVGFTVLSMSMSLIAVFIPILLYGGPIGKLFQEFAVVLAASVLISMVISLTTTAMLCGHLDLKHGEGKQGWLLNASERFFEAMRSVYTRSLGWALNNPRVFVFCFFATLGLTIFLFGKMPTSLMPAEDTGQIQGNIRADQSISFQLMQGKFQSFVQIIAKDPAVQSVVGFTGGGGGPRGGGTNSASVFIQLKPINDRGGLSTDDVVDRLRKKLTGIAGARISLMGARNFRTGGRSSDSFYQYAMLGESIEDLDKWVPKIVDALSALPEFEDVNSDRQDAGLEVQLSIDRQAAARLGISTTQITSTLYDAFGQRQVSTIYEDMNQYHVVMGVAPEFWQSPETLKDIYVSKAGGAVSGSQATAAVASTVTAPAGSTAAGTTADASADSRRNQQLNALVSTVSGSASTASALSTSKETMVPLSAFTSYGPGLTPLSIGHQGPFVATTISFNLAKGKTLGDAVAAINKTMADLHVPQSIHGEFGGNARLFQQNTGNMGILILTAIIAVYIILGVLYESLIHPITIISTLPSAGLGALIALLVARKFNDAIDLNIISEIGLILLIGIVKKNAIMMVDFALDAERRRGLTPREAIYEACLLRFRPIMMTTFAAILGALPLAFGFGTGAELRQPLGIAIVGGLMVSQLLTLYTTPVIYLYMDRFRLWAGRRWNRFYARLLGDPIPDAAE
jgi:multidrug efflux pump